mgnify:CR=1 FL=1
MTVFGLVVIGIYTLFAVVYVPSIPTESHDEDSATRPPASEDELVLLGEKIFGGKGACALCHNPTGGRAPELNNIAVEANARIKDKRYKGGAKNAEEYVYESMVRPSAFVVAGYGVAGTNDTASPMPDVSGGAIGLGGLEIKAVMAFLQKRAGVPVTVIAHGKEAASK